MGREKRLTAREEQRIYVYFMVYVDACELQQVAPRFSSNRPDRSLIIFDQLIYGCKFCKFFQRGFD